MSNFLPVGTVLNGKRKYTIESTLHSGGFGNTYLVKGIVMDENIAQEATYTIKEFYFAKYCTRAADGSVTGVCVCGEVATCSDADQWWRQCRSAVGS